MGVSLYISVLVDERIKKRNLESLSAPEQVMMSLHKTDRNDEVIELGLRSIGDADQRAAKSIIQLLSSSYVRSERLFDSRRISIFQSQEDCLACEFGAKQFAYYNSYMSSEVGFPVVSAEERSRRAAELLQSAADAGHPDAIWELMKQPGMTAEIRAYWQKLIDDLAPWRKNQKRLFPKPN